MRTSSFRSKWLAMKCSAKRVEQLGVRGRVGDPHVVFRLDDAAAEEVLPVAVDQRLAKNGLSGRPSSRPAPARGSSFGRQLERLAAQAGRLAAARPSWVRGLGRSPRRWKIALLVRLHCPVLRPTCEKNAAKP